MRFSGSGGPGSLNRSGERGGHGRATRGGSPVRGPAERVDRDGAEAGQGGQGRGGAGGAGRRKSAPRAVQQKSRGRTFAKLSSRCVFQRGLDGLEGVARNNRCLLENLNNYIITSNY